MRRFLFKKQNIKREEKGAISALVLFTVLMFSVILMGAYFTISTMQRAQIKSDMRIQDLYGKDVEEADKIYEEQVLQNGLKEKFKDNTKVPYVINYPVDIDGDGDSTDDWQVFYIKDYEGEDNAQGDNQPDTGRRVFLIASDYVKILDDPNSAIRKSMEKSHMVQSSDENKKDYVLMWKDPYLALCELHLPDQEGKANIFPKLFEESLYKIWEHQNLPGSICAATMLCTENWSDFKYDTYADYAIGGPTYQMWINSWNMRHQDKQAYYQTNELGYLMGVKGQNTQSAILVQEAQTDSLYLPHASETEGDFDKDSQIEHCQGYWGASPCGLYGGFNLMMVHSNIALTDHFGGDDFYGVRPVVCLKANVKLTPTENVIGIENAECFKIEF